MPMTRAEHRLLARRLLARRLWVRRLAWFVGLWAASVAAIAAVAALLHLLLA